MSGRHKVAAIVCASIHDSGTQNTVMSLVDEAGKRGIRTLVISNFTYYNHDYSPAEMNIFKMISSPVIDGLILLPETIKDMGLWERVLAYAKATGLPFVCVDRDVPDCFSVVFDYGNAFEQVARHMVEVHKPARINFIGGIENNSFSDERLDVFKKVLAENGRQFEPQRFGYGQFWENPTLEVLDRFYNSGIEPPDCIICVNDTEAMTTFQYLKNKGINVPNDVIISGFDGIEEEKYMVPRLTTAACDNKEMSRTSFEMLEQLMRGEKPADRVSTIHYTLRISQSCGCKPVVEGDKTDKLMELNLSKKNGERHERRMFEFCGYMDKLGSYRQFAQLIPEYCECPSWCCIDPLFLDDEAAEEEIPAEKSARMKLLMHCANTGDVQSEDTYVFDVDFDRETILPDIDGVLDKYDSLLICPLSYQGGSMGYFAADMCNAGFNFLFTQRTISNTVQIFETLKTKIRLQKAYAKVADMHMRDPMTGIYNRRGFYMRMAELTEKGRTDFVLFSADLDRLKYINDTFGHYTGDKAIIAAAEAISCAAGKKSVCARFGGDEFIVVIPAEDGADPAVDYIRRVSEAVEEFNRRGKEPFTLSISIGDAGLKVTDRENIDLAMKTADEKMYECKRRHHAQRG